MKTVVRQGFLLSPFLPLLVINWTMKTLKKKKNCFNVRLFDRLDEQDVLYHRNQQMQDKATAMAATSEQVGLKIKNNKTMVNKENGDPVTLHGRELAEVETFKAAFLQLKNI